MNFLVSLIANFLYLIDRKRKKVVFTNLDLVFPNMSEKEKKKFAKKVYYNFVYNIFEIFRHKNVTKEQLKDEIELVGFEKVKDYVNKPAIYISAHYGNWELIGLVLGGMFEIPITVVVRNLDNKMLNSFVKQNREKFDIKTVDKKGALKNLMKAIKSGRSVGLFVDQNTAKSEGMDVEMFGLKALQTPTAALLSKKFNLPIIPVFIQRKGKKYKFVFKSPILEKDIKKSVQMQNRVIEEMIKEKPEEWYWFHRRFKHYYEDKYV